MLSWTASILSAVCLAGAAAPAAVRAEPASGPAADASPEGADLQLEVTLNGAPTGLIGAFRRADDGALFGTSDDLRAMGLNVAAGPAWVRLDGLKGVRADYDAKAQTLAITAAPSAVLTHVISVRAPQEAISRPRSDIGALLNYSLFISDAAQNHSGRWSTPSGGGELEARAFGAFGLISSLFDVEAGGAQTRATRLDSAWTYYDPVRLIDYAAGDVITGGFDWTRPVRLGGLQMRRDFGLAPGLITLPAPSLSATAAVPSVAQVMVNGATVLSQSVQSGPLQVQGLPALQGPSTAQLVLRDQSGRQIATYGGGFYATPQMLTPGLVDFSSEMGFARRYFGLHSQDYDNDLVGSVSVRYGVTDASTVQFHTEGGAGLALAGAGLVQRVGGVGAVEMSVAASAYGGKTGVQLGLGGQSQVGLVTVGVQVLATQGRYADLGAVTAAGGWRRIDQLGVLPPERLVQADLSVPLKGLRLWGRENPTAMIGVSDIQDAVSGDHKVISFSLRQPLFRGASLYIQDPASHIVYVPATESCMDYSWTQRTAAETAAGGVDIRYPNRHRPDSDGNFGRLQAVNMETRQVVWTDRQRAPMASSVLATAGGLVFAGSEDRRFSAYDAATGKLLWDTPLSASPSSSPITYAVHGVQYVAVVAGGGGAYDSDGQSLMAEVSPPSAGVTMMVYRLGK
jgi:outer membrane usher protein